MAAAAVKTSVLGDACAAVPVSVEQRECQFLKTLILKKCVAFIFSNKCDFAVCSSARDCRLL